MALALVPGAQIWLAAGAICSTAKALPGNGDRAFDLRAFSKQ
jgi:hypothetical protein